MDWAKIKDVAAAKIAFGTYLSAQRDREGVISQYILDVEGALFKCQNNMKAIQDYESGLK